VITDRMLKMFRREPTAPAAKETAKAANGAKAAGAPAKDAKASGAV